MSRKWLLGAIALVLFIAAGIVLARREHKPPPAVKPVAAAASPAAEVNFVGRVMPRKTVSVAPPAAGVIDKYFAEVGQEVYQGQLLGKLRNDQTDDVEKKAQLNLDQAQERLTNLNSELLAAKLEISRASADQVRAHNEIDRLEKEYTRQKKFWDQGITPRLTYEKAESDYNAAKAELEKQDGAAARAKDRMTELNTEMETAQHAIEQATQTLESVKTQTAGSELHSPADGIVMTRRGQPGDAVDPGMQDLFTIATELTSLEVDAAPDPAVLPRVHPGQPVSVRVPELSSEEMDGVIREVRGPQVIIDVTSPTPLPRLDLPAQVRIKF